MIERREGLPRITRGLTESRPHDQSPTA